MSLPLVSSAARSALFEPRVSVRPAVIGLLAGEGIGPEVTEAARDVLAALASTRLLQFEVRTAPPIESGADLSDDEIHFFEDTLGAHGAVLCGPRGGRFVYELRARLDLFLKLSPLAPSPACAQLSCLRPETVEEVDILVVRDNIGGIYQGDWGSDLETGQRRARHQFFELENKVRRLLDAAAVIATQRKGRLAVISKAGGLPAITELWHDIALEVAARHGVELELLNVDLAAYRIVQLPTTLDVVACPNFAGDILADVGAVLLGSRGMSFSGNFTATGFGVFQTNHGAAADLAGRDVANPLGQVAALSMLLREGLGELEAAEAIDEAVESVLASGVRTADLARRGDRRPPVGTREMTARVVEALTRR
jgi:3-isopropylmalate dehydrogenase